MQMMVFFVLDFVICSDIYEAKQEVLDEFQVQFSFPPSKESLDENGMFFSPILGTAKKIHLCFIMLFPVSHSLLCLWYVLNWHVL